jgi:hypothetical protein
LPVGSWGSAGGPNSIGSTRFGRRSISRSEELVVIV